MQSEYLYFELKKETALPIRESRTFHPNKEQPAILYELISPDAIRYCHYKSRNQPEGVMHLENPHPFIQLVFSVHGRSRYRNERAGDCFAELDSGQYNLIYFPAQRSRVEWTSHEQTETFYISLLPELFTRYLPDDHELQERLRKAINNQEPLQLSGHNLPLPSSIRFLLYDILHCPLKERYKNLFLRTKLIELLLLISQHHEEYLHIQDPAANPVLREQDAQRVRLAQQLIAENLRTPFTIIELARQVGTNENYLKKHFKQATGQTIYKYLLDLRMQQARRLLNDEGRSMEEVAQLSGYKRVHHFTDAFKKFFGFVPLKLKLWWLSIWAEWDFAVLVETAECVLPG
ncbi:MAG: AraC family transcriptional regulator [Candidatus Pseudobacter hemicellulosilyticus]|uniref:AraC family transcriptional regulator n=1 Tax=Candidatus Pseudobacter hemicellulosilyticus TaxID=3121375 RepID=A0AAJ5WU30_9BACT|nr:MAG: AraC family transcriptional regulator [Pseudobacter sp.]